MLGMLRLDNECEMETQQQEHQRYFPFNVQRCPQPPRLLLQLAFSMLLVCVVLILDPLSDAHHMPCLNLHFRIFYFGDFKGKLSKH